MNETCDCDPCCEEAPKPISRQRRRELLNLADSIAVKFDEIADPRERRLLRRMVDQLITN